MHQPSFSSARGRSFACAAIVLAVVAGCATVPPAGPAAPAATTAAAEEIRPPGRPEQPEQDFARWVEAFAATAREAGIGEETLHAAFDDVRLMPRVVDLDRRQPEFTQTVWDYLERAVSDQRVARGRQKLAEFSAEAGAAAARHGVPASVLVAIWGLESAYGANYGNTSVIDALATLGFEGRREAWARGQLLAALKILQSGDIARAHMLGSWAGAMGQTQFLPSAFLAYAVDADGDGRRDIWGSMADVMASTANFMAQAGWLRGQPWGVEVRLPPGFDHGRADAGLRQPSAAWAAEGVLLATGAALPELSDAAVLLPAGARGPAFLVGANFRAILRYNNSTSYALAVGLLSDAIAGGTGVQSPWPRDLRALSRSQLLTLQQALNERGFASGAPDGTLGPATRDGIRQYQRSLGLPADGYPTVDLLERLVRP
ncbi:lytic murein transglycosylase [Rubrivivax gelatinosus]|uniref:Murein transglycosylase n=1 Tax=Rubrivivax gelatinosus TaxID=28068 RepID=A0ABS1DYI5_RUBGE|nr:lytic murein transglycosylase [Rubrivivax gelatinosus]MBK1713775.1 murein transglycosylase [Rubrivivax gelatinosus]